MQSQPSYTTYPDATGPWANTSGYSSAFLRVKDLQHQSNVDDSNQANTELQRYGQTFAGAFENYVGRAPTADEVSTFYHQVVQPQGTFPGGAYPGQQDLINQTQQFIGTNYQQAAKDTAMQQLQGQQGQAAGLADQYRQLSGNTLKSTAQYLQDYQAQLWNRLQPQILTSLQAQGLLNTGGLNEALAGAQKDLSAQTSGYLADANLQMQNQANQIQYGGASAPYLYQQSNIMNQLPYLQQQGAQGQNYAYNTSLANLNFQNQLALQGNYFKGVQDLQPSFMRTFSQNVGSSLGQSLGKWAAPPGGDSGGLKTMMG